MKKTTGSFKVSPSVLGPLGVEQLSDPALAVLELVKNSWDADATEVRIEITQRAIEVADDGHGMDSGDFKSNWLTIGTPNKRKRKKSPGERPLIGEKGLGRLATFALGSKISISSAGRRDAFKADIDWGAVLKSSSLDEYQVELLTTSRTKGTRVRIEDLFKEWNQKHSVFLADYLRFLTSVPDEKFDVYFSDPWESHKVEAQDEALQAISKGSISVCIDDQGEPSIQACEINGKDMSNVAFRPISSSKRDSKLSGVSIKLLFFLRDKSSKLAEGLSKSRAAALLDEFAGVRIYMDGINVPPYGLRGDDWAALDRQRTSTGGPTMTPGNSQLYGEVSLNRETHDQFIITAGRSGFANQDAVRALAEYVKWTVRELGTARRAASLGIESGVVPARTDKAPGKQKKPTSPSLLRKRARRLEERAKHTKEAAELESIFQEYESLYEALGQNEALLRLFAQLASSGIAATSFAHELRADFDIVTSTLRQIERKGISDSELIQSLNEAWASIKSFASLFQLMPVRIRRKKQLLTEKQIQRSASKVARLVRSQGVACQVISDDLRVKLVPAELDSIALNLVSNALKAVKESANRKTGKIRIEFSAGGSSLNIVVKDNGCGVADSVQEVIYRPLEGTFREGTGMGLPIVQYLVQQYGGSISNSVPTDSEYITEFRAVLKRVIQE